MNTTYEAILAALTANDGLAIDCHGSGKDTVSIVAIAKLGEHTVALLDVDYSEYYSINSMRVGDDGIARITRQSVGVMQPDFLTDSLETAVERYNWVVKRSTWATLHQLTDVLRIQAQVPSTLAA